MSYALYFNISLEVCQSNIMPALLAAEIIVCLFSQMWFIRQICIWCKI